jgi:PAS domain S-box-containing protein
VGGSVGLLLLSFSFVLLRSRLRQKEQWGQQLEAQVRERTQQLEASQGVLAEQARQLASYNQRLEETVRERTRELERKNQELATGKEDLRASNQALLAVNEQLEASVRTAERLSAEALQLSEKQYRDLAESIPDPVVVYDGDLRYVLVNRAVEKLTGLPAAQLLGKTSMEVFGEAQHGMYRKREKACRQVMATGVSLHYDDTIALDGKVYHADLAVYPTAKGGTFVITRDITARVEAEQQYRDLAESLTLPLVVYDRDLRYQYVNKAVEQLDGMPAPALLGKTGREIFGEEFAPRERVCRQVMATGQPVVYREHPVRDGKRHHWEIAVYPTGRGGTLVLNHDITELVEARHQLQEQQEELKASYSALEASEGRLRRVLDSMFIFAGLLSTDGKLLYTNTAPLKGVGVELDDVLGLPFVDTPWFHAEEERQKLKENLAKAARGETVRYDTSTLDRDGNMLYLDLILGPLHNEQGEVVQIIGSGVDITARKEAQTKLQQSNDRYQALLTNFPNGAVFLLDHEMRYQVVGGTGLTEAGFTGQMMLGKTPQEFFPPEMAARTVEMAGKTLAGKSLVYEETYAGRVYQVRTTPVRNEGGQVVAAMLMTQDVTKEKEAEEGLRFYQFLVDHTEDPIYWISPQDNFRFSYVNRAACRHFGLPAEKLLSMSIPDWDPSFTWERCAEFSALIREKKQMVFETSHLHASGEVIPVEISSTLLFYKGQEYYAGYIKDLRERKKAEVALRESEQKFRSLFEANQDALFLLDVDSAAILDVNPTACQVYGYSRQEMLSLRTVDLSAQPEQTVRAPKLRVGKVSNRHHLRKDGTVFPVELSLTYYDQQGRQLCFVSSRDITERVQATRKLEAEKQRLELALWGADLGMWDWHIPSGKVIRNERHEKMLGYEPGELAGTADSWIQALHPDELTSTSRALADYLEGKTDHYRTEHRIRTKSGGWIWMQASGKVVERDAEGKPLRMIGIQQDISEMKQSEESLRFYKYLIDNSPDPIYWIDPDNNFRFAYANEAACRHYGLSRQELLTRSIPDWDPTFTPERCQTHLAYMRANRHNHLETLHRLASGKEVPVEISSFLLVYQGKEYLAGYFRNIAERVEGARKLEEEKQRLELALKGADMGLWDWNVQTGEVHFSERCATMFGYGPSELHPHTGTWVEMGHAEDTPNLTEHLQAHLTGRTTLFQAEHRVRCKDGSWKWVLDSGKVISRDEAGKPLRMVGTCLDITTRKRAEGEIRKLATVAQKTDNAVIITDASGRIEWVNEGFTRMSGYAFGEAVGHKPGALLQGADTDPAAVGKMREAIARHEGVELEVLNYTKDGKPYWVYLSIQPVFDDNAVLRQFIAIQTDISGRKKAEATILELNAGLEQKVEERTAQLQSVIKELEAFSYSVSHDLRSPLRSIDGFSKMLLKDYEAVLDEDGKDYLHTIRQATQRMGHLIDDLLKLSKVSRTELNRFEVNLSGIAAQILGELGREKPERQVTCQVMPDLVAHVDHRLVQIALQNLLSNAWKYTSKKAAATIQVGKASTQKGEAYFVKDNGAGFDMRNADKLFGAFQRLHTTREFDGTGIGLAIVQRIILKHGGEIWAEAAPGQGATFFFTLPGA